MGNARTRVREGEVKRQGVPSIPRQFLDDLNLRSLTELPPLEELGQLVDSVAPGAQVELMLVPQEDVGVATPQTSNEGTIPPVN